MLTKAARTGTLLIESGEYYPDRLLNMSLARAAEAYGPQFNDPYNRTEPVFYQFAGWWALGFLARISGAEPWVIANAIHLFYIPLFFLAARAAYRSILQDGRAVAAGIGILFLFGNLEWFLTGGFSGSYGKHALLMNFHRATYAFYIDAYALLAGFASLACWIRIATKNRVDWPYVILFWLSASVALNLHFLPALLFVLIFFFSLAALTLIELEAQHRDRLILAMSFLALAFSISLAFWSFRPPMPVLLVFGGALWTVCLAASRQRWRFFLPLPPLIALAALTAANLSSIRNHFGIISSGYDNVVREIDLAVPPLVYLASYFPVLLLSGISIVRDTDTKRKAIKAALIAAALAAVFNDKLGYNNHPYRYVPYSYPIWAMLAGDGLVRILPLWRKPLWSATLALSAITLSMGIWSNLRARPEYATPLTLQPASKLILAAARSIEVESMRNRQAVFYLEPAVLKSSGKYPELLTTERLAPYTAAPFLHTSLINFQTDMGTYTRLEDMLKAAKAANQRVDFAVLSRSVPRFTPVQTIREGDLEIHIFRIRNFALESAKQAQP